MGRLSASRYAAFNVAAVDMSRVTMTGEIINASAVATDITDRVQSFGSVAFQSFNYAPHVNSNLELPTMSWVCSNQDGYLSPYASGAYFASDIFEGFTCRYRAKEKLTDPTTWFTFLELEFSLLSVELDGDIARLVSIHPLGAYWGQTWNTHDTHYEELDLNGYTRPRS